MNKSTVHYLYGIHAVSAALTHEPEMLKRLFILNNRNDKRLQELIQQAKQVNVLIQYRERQELDILAQGQQHQGVIAEKMVKTSYGEAELPELLNSISGTPLLLILDGIQDPHNLGACIRTANAAGVHAVIIPKDRAVGLTPVVYKVACGAAEVTPVIQVTNLARTLRMLKEQGIWLFGLAGEAQKTLYQVDFKGAVGLVLGAEDKGLRQLTRTECDELISIPMAGTVSSLNVSVATGVSLFEVVRQRI